MPQPRGNPEKISLALIEKIENAMRVGASGDCAAVNCGVRKETFYRWMRQGREDRKQLRLGNIKRSTLYIQLNDAVERGAEQCILGALMNIHTSAQGRDAEFMLYPKGTKCPETGDDLGGTVAFNGKKPIMKKHAASADARLSVWLVERIARSRFGLQANSDGESKGKGGIADKREVDQIVVHMPSNGREAPGTKIHAGAPALPAPESDAAFPENLSEEENAD